jgi:hypothetical protein
MLDPKIITALISVISSILTIYFLKPLIDKRFHLFKISEDYKHEQAKEIKKTIGKHKSHLMKSAELLHSRLKNFSRNHNESWLNISGDYKNNHYYMDTTVYRFLSFFAQIKLLEDDLEYLDTTNSVEKDMEMLKYFRVLNDVMTDVQLFEKQDYVYDNNSQTDHFFKNKFGQYISSVIKEGRIISYNDFEIEKINFISNIEPVYIFFDGISKAEKRLRLERIKSFHCILIGFLNHYGYDFQQTSMKKIIRLRETLGSLKLKKETLKIVNKYKLKQSKYDLEQIINEYARI